MTGRPTRRAALAGLLALAALPAPGLAQPAPFYDLDRLIADMPPRDLGALRLTLPDAGSEPLAAHAGHLVILNLWATWCAPCLWEMPSLDRLAGHFAGQGLRVVAASVDDGEAGLDGLARMNAHLAANPLTAALARHLAPDARDLLPAYAQLPASFVVLPDAQAVARVDRAIIWDTPELRRRVARWLRIHAGG